MQAKVCAPGVGLRQRKPESVRLWVRKGLKSGQQAFFGLVPFRT